jgi:peptidoglycan/LPS O-acetylase OafA/YrhL
MARPPAIDSLTGLRGVAALWVVAYHAWDAPGGYLGVDLFFVLSGFVLALNYGSAALHRDPRAWAGFLWKRVARLWPAHLAALVLTLGAVLLLAPFERSLHRPTDFSLEGWWATVFLVQAWDFPARPTWNVPAWSISAEWAAYLAFPLLAWMAMQVRRATTARLAIVLLYLALALSVDRFGLSGTIGYAMPRIAAGFCSGVLLHRSWVLRGQPVDGRGAPLAWMLASIGGGAAWELTVGRHSALPWLPILGCALIGGLVRRPLPLLQSGVAQWLGLRSYALYLVNWPVIELCQRLASLRRSAWPDPVVTGIGALVALFLAHLLYREVEEPARRALGARRHPSATVAER